ncbi:GDSL esterase/lipase At1g28570-like isoform X1 [Impatiens glandulifera]|uniref:GDSL esterase/lipase At1g28570-like isoform X1 n=1 Tax=Impatiens glandulifera TaxID=253017 RepID=UPI001FB0DBC8|nr:GDSL esterase/lipase At1g28570-like isoform X1 [Impatiens glandulifera]
MSSAGKLSPATAIFIIIIILLSSFSGNFTVGCYTSIFSFGDSLADTGNSLHLSQTIGYHVNSGTFPFGQTYFHRPTGRFSDGRLIIDFIAQHLGLELIPPYFGERNHDMFMPGINFAVGGSTAMNDSFFDQKGIHEPYKNVSLIHQLSWFKQILPSYCHQSNCREIFNNSLFLLGEIGGNDYNHAFADGRSFEEIQTFVDPVIHSISNTIIELIEIGAVTFIVPGNLPIGCISIYLNNFSNSSKDYYDPETGCIIWLNEFSQYHNDKLQTELTRIRDLHPHTTIIYADYYNSAMAIFRNPSNYGFKEGELGPCCGGSNDKVSSSKNTDEKYSCDGPETKTCDDPSEYINWDGTHLTEAAYKWIFKGLLKDYSYPPMENSLCNGGLSLHHNEL